MALSFPPSAGVRIALRHRFVLALLLCVLIAGGVAAGMAVLVPVDRGRAIRLDAIAAALRGPGDAVLMRRVVATPPAMGGDRWLAVPSAQRQLAALLRIDPADVRLVVASPIGLHRTGTAGSGPVRAGYALSGQVVAAPPPVVTVAPPAPVTVTPAPRPTEEIPPAAAAPVRRRPVSPQRPAVRVPVRTGPAVPVPVPVPAPAPAPVPVPVPVRVAPAAVHRAPPVRLVGAVPDIQGAFVAAWRLPAGGWAVVEPRAETVPTAVQQRILLWFLVALAIALPVAWLMAILLVRPLRRFADAADRSGRDPTVAIAPRPAAELAPAAAAIARLQGRIQALSGDRDAFAGTVRNELCAPLARLRAGLDDAPRQIREAFHDDVTDIEEAVAALQLFLTDAGAAGEMARHDLGELVRRAAVLAATSGEPVTADTPMPVWVMVDAAAIGRLLEQLIEHGRRQGGAVAMAVSTEADIAVLTVRERAKPAMTGFAPGLHAKAEQARSGRPAGPGLAIARSIARVHGGAVRLVRSDRGLGADVRLPLA